MQVLFLRSLRPKNRVFGRDRKKQGRTGSQIVHTGKRFFPRGKRYIVVALVPHKPVYQSDAEGRVWCHWWRVRASGSDPG
jgi:hypothetical protein